MLAARKEPVSAARAMAYAMRTESGRLLFEADAGRKQKHRVCHCGRSLKGNMLSVFRAPDGSRARFQGATMCGSSWTCPICAWRIGEKRQAELKAANEGWVKAGGFVHLLTLTFPHELDEDLGELMHQFDKARQKWRNSATFKKILGTGKAAGCLGTVSSLEATHGGHGWHPHLHILAFVRRPMTVEEGERLTKEWVKQLLKVGLGDNSKLSDMMAHSLDVRGGADAAAYITKYGREEMWGLSHEMAGSVAKEARGEGRKPFGLLRDSMEGDTRAAGLFREFAEAFHGKRLLTWSPGLRDWFGLGDEREDEEVAEDSDAEATQFVGVLDALQWKVVLSRNGIAELENYAATYCTNPETGQRDLNDFIDWLEASPPKSRGWFWTPMQRKPQWMN